jgi:uncharacterized protein (TIRG00374 family)
MRRILSFVLPLVGLALFVAIVARVGPGRVAAVFAAADPVRLALSPLILAAILVMRGLRWRVIMRGAGIECPLRRATAVWAIGFFASSVTPAKVGDAARAFYVREDAGVGFGQAFLTVFVDRLWDLGFVLVAGLVTVVIFSRHYVSLPSTWIVVGAALAIAAAAYAITNRRLMRRLLRPLFDALVPSRYKDRFALNFHTFYDALRAYGRAGGHAWVLLLTLVCWAMIFAFAYHVAATLGIPVRAGYVFLIMPIVTLVELVPVSVSGLGTRDAAVIYFFSFVGVGSAQAVGFSVAYVLIGTYLTALIGFLLWLRHPVPLGGE